MIPFQLALGHERPTIVCLGAHADDIEIGCGGTILRLVAAYPDLVVHWVVLSAAGTREAEARRGAELFLGGVGPHYIEIQHFEDGFFPYEGADVKRLFETLKSVSPDIIFTHNRWDRHQDHRLVNELTWNTFRDHLILEYKIPKYDGDLGAPNCYVPLTEEFVRGKMDRLFAAFPSQAKKRWFTADTFRGLMRLRGVEAGDPSGFAEAFGAAKLTMDLPVREEHA